MGAGYEVNPMCLIGYPSSRQDGHILPIWDFPLETALFGHEIVGQVGLTFVLSFLFLLILTSSQSIKMQKELLFAS